MKRVHFLIAVATVLALASCSTYKNSQTPDDVYYSSGSAKQSTSAVSNNGEYYSTTNDQYVHMLVQNPARWSYFDDYNYDYYGAYGASCFSSFNNFMYGYTPWIGFGYWSPYSYWNSYYTWNSYYNPYYTAVVVANPKAASMPAASSNPYTHMATFSPTSFANNVFNRSNLIKAGGGTPLPYSYSQTIHPSYHTNYNYNSRSVGGHSSGSYYQPSRSYSPSYNSSPGMRTGGSSGFGGGGGMSRPSMGGGGRH